MPISHTELSENKSKDMEFKVQLPLWDFDDVVLPDDILDEIEKAVAIEENKQLIYDTWNLGRVMKQRKGLSMNFWGPSGTGKTMAAHAVANQLKLPILVVDYAEIESKYVGETSKNLIKMFETARECNAMILFDEADALLSKRVTSMNNATDVSVNQTRNVLLRVLDSYDLPIIFTTNFIKNYDEAFFRRISSHIEFKMPDERARKKLWEHYLVPGLPFSEPRDSIINVIASKNNVTGADISNIVLDTAVDCARQKISGFSVDSLVDRCNKLEKFKESISDYQVEVSRITQDEASIILGGTLNDG